MPTITIDPDGVGDDARKTFTCTVDYGDKRATIRFDADIRDREGEPPEKTFRADLDLLADAIKAGQLRVRSRREST